MRKTHKWTGPELRQIQAAADAGMTRHEAAEALGITPRAIAYAVQHYRVLFRRERPGPRTCRDVGPRTTGVAMTLQWKCARCGQGTWLHHDACVACGAAKPAPPPAEPPSDLARPEPPWR